MSLEIVQIDAFTDRPLAGNPAAVCLVPEYPPDVWMQGLAAEMNLSETAFLRRRDDGFDLRWFTPVVEVDLCGHATLASAHFLWSEGLLEAGAEARFHTRSGLLTARRNGDWIEMDFPSEPASEVDPPGELIAALGIADAGSVAYVGSNRFDYLVEVASERQLRAIRPDMGRLAACSQRGVIVTSRAADDRFDFVSRFFGPAAGVDEDPVTGSAHCCLAPFWAEKLGRPGLVGYQASRRGGVVRVRLAGDRALLGGQAVTVLRASLLIDPPA